MLWGARKGGVERGLWKVGCGKGAERSGKRAVRSGQWEWEQCGEQWESGVAGMWAGASRNRR